ncbi:MAG: VWA domain-containing protein [Acidobacteria bacterium]|nr:MAG: VWA domain-containing protein [Acidobacteriota bacterium]
MAGAPSKTFFLSLVLWAAAITAATEPTPPTTLTSRRAITVEVETPTPSSAIDTTSLEIQLGGQATRLLDVQRPATPWQIVLYFDANLATREGVADAASALTRVSRELVRLGEVDVVSANPWPEALAENERDASALTDALAWVSDEAESASEIVITREEFVESGKAGRVDEELREEARRHELLLLRQSREALLGWLSLQSHRGPRCLVLVQDGFDLAPRDFYSAGGAADRAEDSGRPSPELDFETLTRDLAAEGWIVLPLTLADRPEVLSPTPTALQNLADASGGSVIVSPAELAAAIAALAGRWQLTYEASGPVAAGPRQLEIRSARSDWDIRGPRWGSVAPPASLSAARARWMIEEPEWLEQGLPTKSVLLLDQEPSSAAEAITATLEALMLLPGGASGPFRISLLLAGLAGEATVAMETAQPGDLSSAEAWHYRRPLEIPPDTTEAVIVIEDLRSGLWGAANAEVAGSPLSVEGLRVVEHTVGAEATGGAVGSGDARDVVVRLLPPRKRPVTGRTRFNTLISNPAVGRVDFYLDGEMVVSDDRPPFAATLDLGADPDAHAIRAVAYSRTDARMGEHSIIVNPERGSFAVRITGIAGRVEAEVNIPPGESIDRVEFYRNETLVARLEAPPWQAQLPGAEAGPSDYVRVAAFLKSGESMEDARLLSSPGIEERVEVNLVELNVVVTDRDDAPVRGLEPENFAVFFRGQPHAVQRFALAEEIPLVLGLVIDTSESMITLMTDTKKAGAQFLGETLREGDEAFLVDFDTRPRLAREATGDFVALLRQFNSLRPEGFTALYDAIIFSLLQFEEASGRKALVLLTDGDDYRSKYGPRRCIQYGRQLGVPVYIISLGAMQSPRRGFRRIDLEGITEGTGGKVFYISEMAELSGAYAQINDELRSQYVLAFATDHPLTDEEFSAIDVKVTDKELSVRTVVGGQSLD